MRNLKLTQKTIDSERQVVKEELRLRLENNPVGKALRRGAGAGLHGPPLSQIGPAGEKSDLDTVTPADCQKFYDEYYQPNNATLDRRRRHRRGDGARRWPTSTSAPLREGADAARTTRRRSRSRPRCAKRRSTMPVQLPVIVGGYHIPAGDERRSVRARGAAADPVGRRVVAAASAPRAQGQAAVVAGGFVFAHEDPGLFLTFAAYLPDMDAEKLEGGARRGDRQGHVDEGRRRTSCRRRRTSWRRARSIERERVTGAGQQHRRRLGRRRTIRRGRSQRRRSSTRSPPTTCSAWPRSTW